VVSFHRINDPIGLHRFHFGLHFLWDTATRHDGM